MSAAKNKLAIPKRSLSELTMLYQFEPSVRDVYVEGRIDAKIVRSLLKEHNVTDVTIYEIDSIDIPPPQVVALGFTPPNSRAEVIALATHLTDSLSPYSLQATCIVDKDLDVFGKENQLPNLLYTDFSCMEAYAFELVTLTKLFRFCDVKQEENFVSVFHSFSAILIDLFCLRVADMQLGWGLKKLNIRNFLRMESGHIRFELEEYVVRLMNKNNRHENTEQFIQAMKEAKKLVPEDSRHCANGHDLIELLEWFFHQVRCINGKAVSEVVSTAIYCVMEFKKLGESGMFRELLCRVRSR